MPRANPVAEESASNRSGEIEHVDQSVPAKCFPKRCGIPEDKSQPFRRVDAEGIRRKIIDEPYQGHHRQAEPVKPCRVVSRQKWIRRGDLGLLDDKPPWCPGILHRLSIEFFRLFEL